MKVVSMSEARTHLSRLVAEAAGGDEIVIAKGGQPVARLVGLGDGTPDRAPGFLKGRIKVAADFDAPLPDTVQTELER